MNKKALFCDGTSQYVNPSEPERNEEVAFRFRTAKEMQNMSALFTRKSGMRWRRHRRAKYLTIMR